MTHETQHFQTYFQSSPKNLICTIKNIDLKFIKSSIICFASKLINICTFT